MERKTISFYITNIVQGAGTERAVVNVANSLANEGYLITIYSISSCQGNSFYNVDSSIKIIHLGLREYVNASFLRKVASWILNFIEFIKIRDTNYILIGTSRNINLLLLSKKKKKWQKVIGCEHFPYNSPMNPVVKVIKNNVYRHLTTLVVLSERDRSYYLKNKINNVVVIPNFNTFDPLPKESLAGKQKIVLAVGRHVKQKAFNKMLHIWSIARSFNQDWQLYIVGGGDLFDENVTLAKMMGLTNVFFVPPTQAIWKYYEKASVYAMTSLYEAFPMVLLEAKTCGVPIVSYDCSTGPKEIIKENEDGFVIPMDNANMFVEKLRLLLTDDNLRKTFAVNALHNSKEYSKEHIIPLWLGVLNDLE